MAEQHLNYQQTQHTFSSLNHNEYWILAVYGIWGDELNAQYIDRILKRAGIQSSKQISFTHSLVKTTLYELNDQWFDEESRPSRMLIQRRYRDAVARSVFIAYPNRAKKIVSALNQVLSLPSYIYSLGYQRRNDSPASILRLQYLNQDFNYFFSNYSNLNRNAQWDEDWIDYVEEFQKCLLPYDTNWIAILKGSFQTLTMEASFFSDEFCDANHEQFQALLTHHESFYNPETAKLRFLSSHLLLRQGELKLPDNLKSDHLSFHQWHGLLGTWALIKKENDKAKQYFKKFAKLSQGKGISSNLFSYIYLLWFYLENNEGNAQTIHNKLQSAPVGTYSSSHLMISMFFQFHIGEEEDAIEALRNIKDEFFLTYESKVVWLWCARWIGLTIPANLLLEIENDYALWQKAGFNWLVGEAANVLSELHPNIEKRKVFKAQAAAIAERVGIQQYIGDLFKHLEDWERVLKSFERLTISTVNAVNNQRVIWLIDFENKTLQPKEQKIGKNGKWTSGRKVPLTQILYDKLESLTSQDKSTSKALRNKYKEDGLNHHYQYSNHDLLFDFEHAVYLLADHPYLFLDGKQQIPLEILKGTPKLFVSETENGIQLKIDPPIGKNPYIITKETPTRYKAFHINEDQKLMARPISTGVNIPKSAIGRLENTLDKLGNKIQIHSTLELSDSDLPKVNGDPRPCLHLLPFGEGLKLQFTSKPIPKESFYFPTGDGLAKQILDTQNGQVVCIRDLITEQELTNKVIEACPTLTKIPSIDQEWHLEEMQDCLQLLLELRPLKSENLITLEHPKGEKIKLVSVNGTSDLSMRISKERDWFSVKGSLKVDEQQVLSFQHLLEHIQKTDSAFVEIKEGEFIALTDEFRQRLVEMEGMMHKKGKHMQLPMLAAPAIESFSEELADLEADAEWAERLERMRKAQRIRPRLPKTFKAELRHYQDDGFRWLMRLAEWGVGACLADDMGLGKTVQALALLDARKKTGPALVIAPASVTRNWLREAKRFTPSLKTHLLQTSKDMDWVTDLGPSDILMVSYGLLPFAEEVLTEKMFGTVVLDEAQAIKNRATKRSKIVMKLQTDFRLATTGTPIENHLGELWNLFRFLNPGLLGSHQVFSDKFAKPILKDNDDIRREHLRRLIRPFILRRLKSEVLTELPPKTEVTLNVELSAEELAFYESLRRRALEEIDGADGGQKRFMVLAQLTKLRQAACHPRLVDKNSRLPSSKLQLVGETVLELLENGHKVLIFSQFVRHLKLVEQWVKYENIPYQYLDGQTPSAKRELSIQAFQRGEGELFLISLKAGGTGLNLTEADYVLHLDPWWNPAVEDQASDRAHRIGQQRPVTVYRFVSEHTIEEKIVALHQEKRKLADQLLSGTGASAKLSVDDMLDLLRD